MTQGNKPFAGLKVVELATYLAAPVAARILGDWGAEVVKIESTGGDVWRFYGKNFQIPATETENAVFDIPNANKQFLSMNLKDAQGMEILHRLLAEADVFITNNRLEPLKKMGLDYESLKERYPRLIYGIITGFGEEGPDAAKPGFDTVAYWASGGFMSDMRVDNPGSYPIYTPAGVADMFSGTLLFGGISAALYHREKTGTGDKLSISLFGAAVWSMGVMNTITQEGYDYPYPKKRYESKPTAVCYECSDGEWVMISALEYDRFFPPLCTLLGVPELIEDPRFRQEADMMRPENKAVLVKIFEERFAAKTAAEWSALLTQADIVHDRLAHYREISKSEQAKVNHFIQEVTFASGTKKMLPCCAIQSDNLGVPEYRLSRGLGADSAAVLSRLGYSTEQIGELSAKGVIKG